MIVRSLDANGDWNFGKGKSDYLRANDAVGQNIATRLRSFLGDCFFDLDAGLDWWNLLGSKNVIGTNLAIRSAIQNTPKVKRILELSNVLDDNRSLSVSYSVTTEFSTQDPIKNTVGVP